MTNICYFITILIIKHYCDKFNIIIAQISSFSPFMSRPYLSEDPFKVHLNIHLEQLNTHLPARVVELITCFTEEEDSNIQVVSRYKCEGERDTTSVSESSGVTTRAHSNKPLIVRQGVTVMLVLYCSASIVYFFFQACFAKAVLSKVTVGIKRI